METNLYNDDFYRRYQSYLQEPEVKRKHIRAAYHLTSMVDNTFFTRVVDLGCGQSQEFFHIAELAEYVGIDLNVKDNDEVPLAVKKYAPYRTRTGNYRNDLVEILNQLNYQPQSFVSLFSVECTDTQENNYKYYDYLFTTLLQIKAGLVSGFYYADKLHVNPIEEAGGIQSYQTLSQIQDHKSTIFDEYRLTMNVPSEMFGKNVFEVWKLLVRR